MQQWPPSVIASHLGPSRHLCLNPKIPARMLKGGAFKGVQLKGIKQLIKLWHILNCCWYPEWPCWCIIPGGRKKKKSHNILSWAQNIQVLLRIWQYQLDHNPVQNWLHFQDISWDNLYTISVHYYCGEIKDNTGVWRWENLASHLLFSHRQWITKEQTTLFKKGCWTSHFWWSLLVLREGKELLKLLP